MGVHRREPETPQDLITNHQNVVDGAFRILNWLGLAEPDKELEFGYKPTSRLIQILVNRGAGSLRKSKKKGASIIDVDALFSIFDAAMIELSDQELRVSACMLLRTLGLVRITQRGEEVPTQELRELVAERRDLRARSEIVALMEEKEGYGHGKRHLAAGLISKSGLQINGCRCGTHFCGDGPDSRSDRRRVVRRAARALG